MHFYFLHMLSKGLEPQPGEHTPGTVHEHPHDTTEGSEFLDDAIRMKDQPLTYTEEPLQDAPDSVTSNRTVNP